MGVEEITIKVDSEAASAYRTAGADQRRKLDLLLSLRLHEIMGDGRSLEDVMHDVSRRATERGLAPEIQAILDER